MKHYIIATQTGYLLDEVTGYPHEFHSKEAAVKALAAEVKDAAQACRRSYKTCSVVGSARKGSVQIRVGGRQGYHLWQRYVINERPGARKPPRAATSQKTSAQLDAEIAEALSGSQSAHATKGHVCSHACKAHATKKKPRIVDVEAAKAREISDRRIAALIANGEDIRNTPAWRDAMSESRMINFQLAPPRLGIDRSKHTLVNIRWYAIPNGNKFAGGFLPVIEEDGKVRGDTWAGRGYAKAEAEALAEAKAHEAASRFVGDWNVVLKKGRPAR